MSLFTNVQIFLFKHSLFLRLNRKTNVRGADYHVVVNILKLEIRKSDMPVVLYLGSARKEGVYLSNAARPLVYVPKVAR